jgi:hypothetical protein
MMDFCQQVAQSECEQCHQNDLSMFKNLMVLTLNFYSSISLRATN